VVVNLPSSAGTLVVDATAITDVEGVGLSSSGGVLAVAPTELAGSQTFGDASTDTIVWTWDRQTGTDVTMTVASGAANFTGLQVGGVPVLTSEVDGSTTNELVTLTADSGGTTSGTALTLAGGTTGLDTSRSGDTVTFTLDTTELAATTFGSGSGFTWTFDSSATTDPSLIFGTDLLTSTGNLTISNRPPLLTLADTAVSAKDLLVKVDADKAYLQELVASDGSLLTLDLAANRLGIGEVSPQATLHIAGTVAVNADQKISMESAASSGDSYLMFNSAKNCVSIIVNGIEVARLRN